jgi:hypothetical protein
MNKNKIAGIGFAIFLILAWFFTVYRVLFYNYEVYIALSLSIVVVLLTFLPILGIYKLAQRKKKIEKQVDEYFQKK